MSDVDRPAGVVLDDGGDVRRMLAVVGAVSRGTVDVVDGHPVAAALADALRNAATGFVVTAPSSASGLDAEDLRDLLDAAGREGVIATDGVRDVPSLGVWPRARAVELAVAARGGTGLSGVTASMARVRLPLRVFGRDRSLGVPSDGPDEGR